jgi:hypothetical protein
LAENYCHKIFSKFLDLKILDCQFPRLYLKNSSKRIKKDDKKNKKLKNHQKIYENFLDLKKNLLEIAVYKVKMLRRLQFLAGQIQTWDNFGEIF